MESFKKLLENAMLSKPKHKLSNCSDKHIASSFEIDVKENISSQNTQFSKFRAAQCTQEQTITIIFDVDDYSRTSKY